MTQQTNLAAAFLRIVQSINTIATRQGNLANLTTTDKTSLVAALNEVKAMIPDVADVIDDNVMALDSTWSSSKIQDQINNAITAIINGADGTSDTLKELADKIVALAQADNGLLSFTQAQTLTPQQQLQAGNNLGIGDPNHNYVTAIEANLAAGL